MPMSHEEILQLMYGHGAARRYTQDSPVLPDVWAAFAENPHLPQDVLLTPYLDPKREPLTAGKLCQILAQELGSEKARSPSYAHLVGTTGDESSHDLAYNQANVVVRLWFDELVRVILPLSAWWNAKVAPGGGHLLIEDLQKKKVQEEIASALAQYPSIRDTELSPDLLWTIRVAGTIALAQQKDGPGNVFAPAEGGSKADYLKVVRALAELLMGIDGVEKKSALVHLVSLNRPATNAIWRSTSAVKADAAQTLFNIRCQGLAWAIVDSGIDASHPAFFSRTDSDSDATAQHWSKRTRVVATYDFTIIRLLLSADPAVTARLPASVQQKLQQDPFLQTNFRQRLQTGHDIDWSLIKDFIQLPHTEEGYQPPVNAHGTHVGGIIAADWPANLDGNPYDHALRGMCPDINLYDFRVLDANGEGDEFNVMAALQFIRYLNAHNDYTVLHGVNLSLSIPHDVRNYACGRTPVCEECERLIGAGVVVVAAAGNEGYRTSVTGEDDGYRSMRISDPGNAECVITVGSTHRDAPHTYGVSYFSSRGPTGDGRVKPDLVAPGEKIESTLPDRGVDRKDGTSQAAPHVSGAAALLMGRHSELIGRPEEIKKILCKTATDLGREKYFQGCGLVDVLRALQSV
jgi:subtilisin family serine protease